AALAAISPKSTARNIAAAPSAATGIASLAAMAKKTSALSACPANSGFAFSAAITMICRSRLVITSTHRYGAAAAPAWKAILPTPQPRHGRLQSAGAGTPSIGACLIGHLPGGAALPPPPHSEG